MRIFFFGLIIVPLVAHGQIAKTARGYSFRIRLAQGQVFRYKTVVSRTGATGKNAINVELPLTQIVTAVSGGIADVVVRSGPMTINAQPIGEATSYHMRIDGRGKLVGGDIGPNSGIIAFPDKPIRPGHSWTAQMPINATGAVSGGGSMVSAQYKFKRFRTVAGKSFAELEVSLSSLGNTKVQGSGVQTVSAIDGGVLKSDLDITAALGPSAPPVTLHVSIKRL